MQLKYEFEKIEMNGKIFAVPVGEAVNDFHGVIKMNDTALAIFDLLKDKKSEEEIVSIMAEEYEVDRDILANDVGEYILAFREKGFIAE